MQLSIKLTDNVWVELTQRGAHFYNKYEEETRETNEQWARKKDNDLLKAPLWLLMDIFGQVVDDGKIVDEPCFKGNIIHLTKPG